MKTLNSGPLIYATVNWRVFYYLVFVFFVVIVVSCFLFRFFCGLAHSWCEGRVPGGLGRYSGLKKGKTFVKLLSALFSGSFSHPRIGRSGLLLRALDFDTAVPGFKSCTDHCSLLHVSGDPFYFFDFESSFFGSFMEILLMLFRWLSVN